jgi:hypothetical protein
VARADEARAAGAQRVGHAEVARPDQPEDGVDAEAREGLTDRVGHFPPGWTCLRHGRRQYDGMISVARLPNADPYSATLRSRT